MMQVVISGDILMTSPSEQKSNTRWLKMLTERPITHATGFEIVELENSTLSSFDQARFFALSGLQYSRNSVHNWFDAAAISNESIRYLSEFISSSTLLIGYELSASTRAILQACNIHYVDIWLHPVRFMDDVMFAVNSNIPSSDQGFHRYCISPEQIHLEADRLKVQSFKGWKRADLSGVTPNSALFAGQMLSDKSVCSEGKMLTILDYKDEVDHILRDHTKLYYSRHPYLRYGDEEILRYIKNHPRIEISEHPTYDLLASDHIKTVLGVSSSLIEEAKYFGKTTQVLYRPVIPLNPAATAGYKTIMHGLISPAFWSAILAGAMSTRPVEHLEFLNPKDKLRDALGFYWSYAQIDKLEYSRTNKSATSSKINSIKSQEEQSRPSMTRNFQSGYITDSDFSKLISDKRVVSFDVFDTLIERKLLSPNDIHYAVAVKANEAFGVDVAAFIEARKNSKRFVKNRNKGEEVTLLERYEAIADHLALPIGSAQRLVQIEEKIDLLVCYRKETGYRLLQAALNAGKRVILISDIYYSQEYMANLLESCDVRGFSELYLSSEIRLLKHTGNIYPHILKLESLAADDLFHVGDNEVSDITQANKHGIKSLLVPAKEQHAAVLRPGLRAHLNSNSPTHRSLIGGLISTKATSELHDKFGDYFGGSAKHLGYTSFGPMIYGFARHILSDAKSKGITDLYFLARDGEIVKKVYDVLAAGDSNAPKSHYTLASRRSVSVPTIRTPADIKAHLDKSFATCTLAALARQRFGVELDGIPLDVFQQYGFTGPDSCVRYHKDRQKLKEFLTCDELFDLIAYNANDEYRHMIRAFRSQGIGRPEVNPGFVDIGHSATLQAAIARLMDLPSSTGYYFATKSDVDQNLPEQHSAHGYAFDRISFADKNHEYQKYILMFEILFQNTSGSFVRYREVDNELTSNFLPTDGDQARRSFIECVHNGVIEFAHDLDDLEHKLGYNCEVSIADCVAHYLGFLKNPSAGDASIFIGVGFENNFSLRQSEWIIAPDDLRDGKSLWREGVASLVHKVRVDEGSWRTNALAATWARLILNPRKRAKFLRDPETFFLDSKNRLVRKLHPLFS